MKFWPHIAITVIYVLVVLSWASPWTWSEIKPNTLGDFLAGAFSPVAFYWFVVTAFLQRAELRETRLQFERQASAAEEQTALQVKRDKRETKEDFRREIDEAIESIPMRVKQISEELSAFDISRSGHTGEDLPDEQLRAMRKVFCTHGMTRAEPSNALNFAADLRRRTREWNDKWEDEHGTYGMMLYANNEDFSNEVRARWRALMQWHLRKSTQSAVIDDLSFDLAAKETGLEDLRYAYYQVFPPSEKDLWWDLDGDEDPDET